jgi:hypothetical protein
MYEIECIEEDIKELQKILNFKFDNGVPLTITNEKTYVKLEKYLLDNDKMNERIRIKIIEAVAIKNCINLSTYVYTLDNKIKELRALID